VKAAGKDFEDVPRGTRDNLLDALTAVAEGEHPSIAKPLTGLGCGVVELASRHRGEALRVVYALRIGEDIWVIHAFQKKPKSVITTPRQEIDLHRRSRVRCVSTDLPPDGHGGTFPFVQRRKCGFGPIAILPARPAIADAGYQSA
jgi:phage-related protein